MTIRCLSPGWIEIGYVTVQDLLNIASILQLSVSLVIFIFSGGSFSITSVEDITSTDESTSSEDVTSAEKITSSYARVSDA
jgi:hypothetical protein